MHGAIVTRKICNFVGGCTNNAVKGGVCKRHDTYTDTYTDNVTVVSTTDAKNVTMDTSIVAQRILVFQSDYALCGVHDKKYTIVDMSGSSDGVILPNHPNHKMNDSYVLPSFHADIVTQPVKLPPNPDTSKMYLFQASTTQDNDCTFVSKIYYSSNTVDTLTASDAGTHTRRIFDIRSLLSSHGNQSGVSGGGNVALASGQYLELGFGFLPG
jgi:hypothetical protein